MSKRTPPSETWSCGKFLGQVAYCGEGEHNGESETIVKYDTISVAFNTSSSGGLDRQTGVFTAPYDGVYEISVFLSIEQTRESREGSTKVLINKNGVAIPNSNIEYSPQHIWTYGGLIINNIIAFWWGDMWSLPAFIWHSIPMLTDNLPDNCQANKPRI